MLSALFQQQDVCGYITCLHKSFLLCSLLIFPLAGTPRFQRSRRNLETLEVLASKESRSSTMTMSVFGKDSVVIVLDDEESSQTNPQSKVYRKVYRCLDGIGKVH